MIAHLKCTACGAEYPAETLMNLCPVDNRPVEIIIDLERMQSGQPNLDWYRPERKDMWRFGGLLPLDIANPEDQPFILSLGEGNTPWLDYNRPASAWASKTRARRILVSAPIPLKVSKTAAWR